MGVEFAVIGDMKGTAGHSIGTRMDVVHEMIFITELAIGVIRTCRQ